MLCQRCRLPIAAHKSLVNMHESQQQLFHEPDKPVGRTGPVVLGHATEDACFIVLTETLNPLLRAPEMPPATSLQPNGTSIGPNASNSPTGGRPTAAQPANGVPLPGGQSVPSNAVHGRSGAMSRETDMLERLFDYLSGKSDLDLPLCQDCANSVRQGLKSEYDGACQERDAYITLLNKVKDEPAVGSQEVFSLNSHIERLESECQSALTELEAAEQAHRDASLELTAAKAALRNVDHTQADAYEQRNQLESGVLAHTVETRRLEALAEYQESQLRRLQQTNVYNDVFCIGHEGKFGTINGLRLGRLNDTKVEWSEINAAWGQTLLLLATLIAKLGIKIPEYRLKPLGSMSRIDKLDLDPETGDVLRATALDLYSSDYSFERFLYPKKLDVAMAAFLDILKRVGEHVESCDPTLRLPYAIDGDKIGSVRLSLNSSNESWTAACRYVLTNARWILAFSISH